jgi:hypothetical protein
MQNLNIGMKMNFEKYQEDLLSYLGLFARSFCPFAESKSMKNVKSKSRCFGGKI